MCPVTKKKPMLLIKNTRPLAKIVRTGNASRPTRVIFSGGVGVPPAQEFAQKECEQETP